MGPRTAVLPDTAPAEGGWRERGGERGGQDGARVPSTGVGAEGEASPLHSLRLG